MKKTVVMIALALALCAAGLPGQSGWCRDLGGRCGALGMRCSRLPNIGCNEFNAFVSNLGFRFQPAVMLVGPRLAQPVPLPDALTCGTGCRVFVAPGAIQILFTPNRIGTASVFLPIPNDPTLIGLELALQAARVDTAKSCIEVGNGLLFRVGRGPCR